MEWTVEFLDETVRDEFDALPPDMQASLAQIAELVRSYGLEKTGMPYVRHLRGKLWEMRGRGRDGIARSIYVAARGRRVVIVRCFIKKTGQTPSAQLEIAFKRAKEVR